MSGCIKVIIALILVALMFVGVWLSVELDSLLIFWLDLWIVGGALFALVMLSIAAQLMRAADTLHQDVNSTSFARVAHALDTHTTLPSDWNRED